MITEMSLLFDVLEPLCARGFLQQATRLSLTSKAVAATLPMGTGRQMYDAVEAGHDGELTVYLEYWRGNRDSPNVLNWTPDGRVEPPLAAAARWGHLTCSKLLVSFAPALDVNKGDLTALHWACRLGRAPMVRVLLSVSGIDANKATRDGRRTTPLHEASKHGHAAVVRFLVAVKGIELEATNVNDETSLILAEQGQHYEVVAILKEAVERKRMLAAAGREVYDVVYSDDTAALRPLLEQWSGNEVVLNWVCHDFFCWGTAIGGACTEGNLEVVQLLVSTPGLLINTVDYMGWSPLMTAAWQGGVEIVRLLLTVEGIDVNTRATKEWAVGMSALDIAVMCARIEPVGRQEVVALLRAVGAEERIKSEEEERLEEEKEEEEV